MKATILFILFFLSFSYLKAQTAEVITKKVADNLIQNTFFRFVNTTTGEEYSSTKNVPYSRYLKVESNGNEWYYMNGVIHIAMLQLADLVKDRKYADFSREFFSFVFTNQDYFKKQYDEKVPNSSFSQNFRLEKLDDCGALSAALVDFNKQSPKADYAEYLEKVADYMLLKQVRLKDGTFVRPEPRKMTLWADDLYMSVPFLARMGALTGDRKYFDEAIRQVENFTNYLWDNNRGLFYHCWYSDVELNGVAHWGRCNGWVMMAQTELLNFLPADHPKRKMLIHLLLQQIAGVSRYQDTTGLWHQVLDKPDSYLETSCTAMFTYCIAKAVNEGWINKSYLYIAAEGWKGLISKTDGNGNVKDICIGTGIEDNIHFYYSRPTELNDLHGLGAILLAGIEITKVNRKSIP